jgi:hypothetical protein
MDLAAAGKWSKQAGYLHGQDEYLPRIPTGKASEKQNGRPGWRSSESYQALPRDGPYMPQIRHVRSSHFDFHKLDSKESSNWYTWFVLISIVEYPKPVQDSESRALYHTFRRWMRPRLFFLPKIRSSFHLASQRHRASLELFLTM